MRPDILNPLFAEVETLKGVGDKLMKALARLKIARVKDIAYHFPSQWKRRMRIDRLSEAGEGQQVVIALSVREYRTGGSSRAPMRIVCADKAGDIVNIVYFGKVGRWARGQFPVGEERVVAGRLDRFGEEWQIVHPDHVVEPGGDADIPAMEPIYPLADGLSNGRMQDFVATALERLPDMPEWSDASLVKREGWGSWRDSLCAVHAPDPEIPDKAARDRLAYDELLANQMALQLVRQSNDRRRAHPIRGDGRLVGALKLPFAYTGAQERTISEVERDLARERPMLRLLQGDVGAGKTLVAFVAMLRAVEAGFQAAFLAPTEILARQHYESLRELARGLPIHIEILTGRDKGKAREGLLMGLADGSIDILVGTHAIFQDTVSYRNLGLAVIDEQHRFGVSQRLMLTRKAERAAHLLVMTATPIPRTLTLAVHGEMDVSQLDELPPGRTPVDTRVLSVERIDELIDGLGRHIAAGRQAFWVCPLVEESENSDMVAAEDRAAILQHRFGDARVGLVHGRMKGPDKDAVMERFAAGDLSVLVATTVIEVGVNVPNASLMIVENADRFGLAQLHQLRGRVGRGAEKSVCMLVRPPQMSETARARLALMRETNDGFRIAEEDLRLRGAGEMLGTRQSGEAAFQVADDAQVSAYIEMAKADAELFVTRDGGLQGARGEAARLLLYLFEREAAIETLRSG